MVIGRPLKSSPQPPCNACRHTGDVDATCCEDAVSGVSRAEPDIYSTIFGDLKFVCFACEYRM